MVHVVRRQQFLNAWDKEYFYIGKQKVVDCQRERDRFHSTSVVVDWIAGFDGSRDCQACGQRVIEGNF